MRCPDERGEGREGGERFRGSATWAFFGLDDVARSERAVEHEAPIWTSCAQRPQNWSTHAVAVPLLRRERGEVTQQGLERAPVESDQARVGRRTSRGTDALLQFRLEPGRRSAGCAATSQCRSPWVRRFCGRICGDRRQRESAALRKRFRRRRFVRACLWPRPPPLDALLHLCSLLRPRKSLSRPGAAPPCAAAATARAHLRTAARCPLEPRTASRRRSHASQDLSTLCSSCSSPLCPRRTGAPRFSELAEASFLGVVPRLSSLTSVVDFLCRTYTIKIVQQPVRARMCGLGDRVSPLALFALRRSPRRRRADVVPILARRTDDPLRRRSSFSYTPTTPRRAERRQ